MEEKSVAKAENTWCLGGKTVVRSYSAVKNFDSSLK